jgi:hypothetical protein
LAGFGKGLSDATVNIAEKPENSMIFQLINGKSFIPI